MGPFGPRFVRVNLAITLPPRDLGHRKRSAGLQTRNERPLVSLFLQAAEPSALRLRRDGVVVESNQLPGQGMIDALPQPTGIGHQEPTGAPRIDTGPV